MAKRTVRTKLTAQEVRKIVKDLPGILTGSKKSVFKLRLIFWGAVAHSLYINISKAYDAKSDGYSDELGNSWDDLSVAYKAYKIPVRSEDLSPSQRSSLKNKKTLGLLTPEQYKIWQNAFGHIYHSLKEESGEEKAKEEAGRSAWTLLKSMGADTKLEKLGTRKVPIMKRSGKLRKSFDPGTFNPESGYKKTNRSQIFKIDRSRIIIGSSLGYAKYAASRRPIIPDNVQVWITEAVRAGRDAVISRLATALRA